MMIRRIERHWFEVWGTETAQNRFLKGLLVLLLSFLILQGILIVVLALRKPLLVAIGPAQTGVLKVMPPSKELLESEITRVASEYVSKHHNWDWQKIEQTQNEAAKLVASGFEKLFFKANAEQTRLAKEKRLSQKFYVGESSADFKARTVRVKGDRILLVEGLRATNPMTLEVSYDFGSRTESNPAGIYITAEKLISEPERK